MQNVLQRKTASLGIALLFAAIMPLAHAQPFAGQFECDDRVDNDNDGYIDYPADGGCRDYTDASEAGTTDSAVGEKPLQISVTDGKVFAHPHEEITYSIFVKNRSYKDAIFTLRTSLPGELGFINATVGYVRDRQDIEWRNEFLAPGEAREYFLTVFVERDVANYQTITVRFSAGAATASDTTSITTVPAPTQKSLSISDNMARAAIGSYLEYHIIARNLGNALATDMTVNVSLPQYVEFVDATEGGYWIGDRVHWKGLTVSPFGERHLMVKGRIRSDAPFGARLQAVARFDGVEAVDITDVAPGNLVEGQSLVASTDGCCGDETFLSKVADSPEVRPGDVAWFTVKLRNTKDHPIQNIRIEDRFDPRYMELMNPADGVMVGDALVWSVPMLAPGQEWVKRYAVRISPDTPHGMELKNVVTASGEGLEPVSLTERIFSGKIGVIRKLPPTGAANDAIFLGFLSLLGIAPTAFMRRKLLGGIIAA